MILDRQHCADYLQRKREQKPGISAGALVWGVFLFFWFVAVLAWLMSA